MLKDNFNNDILLLLERKDLVEKSALLFVYDFSLIFVSPNDAMETNYERKR